MRNCYVRKSAKADDGSNLTHRGKLDTLIICHAFPPDMGGASFRGGNLAKALSARGHNVDVIAAFPYYPHGQIDAKYRGLLYVNEAQNEILVRRVWIPALPTKGLLNRIVIYLSFVFSYAISLLAMYKKHFDIVYFVSPYPLSFFSLPACVFGKLKRAVVILDVHDLWPEVIVEVAGMNSKSARGILIQMARMVSTLSNYVTTITQAINEKMIEIGLPSEKLRIVSMSIDTQFYSHRKTRGPIDPRFSGKFIAEYSGVLARKYDFDTLIQAARILQDKSSDILVLVRGDGEQKERVLRSAKSVRNVVVLTKIVSSDVVVDYLNSADVLVCPLMDSEEGSRGIPSKVFEYLSVAKPVICSGRGETAELILSKGVGLAVPPGDPEALADAIFRLFRDSHARRLFSERARRLAESEFSWEGTTRKIEVLHAQASAANASY